MAAVLRGTEKPDKIVNLAYGVASSTRDHPPM